MKTGEEKGREKGRVTGGDRGHFNSKKGRSKMKKGRFNPKKGVFTKKGRFCRPYLRRSEKLGWVYFAPFSPGSPVSRRPWGRRDSQLFCAIFLWGRFRSFFVGNFCEFVAMIGLRP